MSSQNFRIVFDRPDFRIVFDRPDATYAPGEIVTGQVLFTLSNPVNINELKLKSKGMAATVWTTSNSVSNSDGSTSSETEWHGTREHYFKTSNRIVGSEKADEPITLAAGPHSYKFSLQLPVNIPDSFEHTYGHIRYIVKAVVDRPLRFDHKVDSAIKISTLSDEKPKQVFISAIDDEIEHQFVNFFCLNGGVMKVDVKSQANKFSPGDSIELMVSYDRNTARVDIMDMQLKFVKNMTFIGTGKDKEHASETLNKVKNTGPFGKKGETTLRLVVPSVIPLDLQHCSIIHIDYALALYIKISGMHSTITRSYPVDLL